MGLGAPDKATQAFDAEVARLHSANVFGASGRLRELFDFLARRGEEGGPASQAEIAETVFGQADGGGDDATVRVYIHRLRKRLDDFYAANEADTRLVIPAGSYALRLAGAEIEPVAATAESRRTLPLALGLLAALALAAAAFFAGHALWPEGERVNAFWQPFAASKRPLTIVLGDYYIFGEIDDLRPEDGRLIRDFRINSPTDLARAQETEPARYGNTTDMGLNYLPFSASYALREVIPVLARTGRQVQVIAASQFHADELRDSDIVYIGLVSGMGMLEDTVFDRSSFGVGESYDELQDTVTGKTYTSREAQSLALPVSYNDYGYFARFRAPGGALVAVIAGTRDTGLRGVSPLLSDDLDAGVAKLARGGDFEGLYQITGQQGADLSKQLVVARPRK